LKYCKQLGLELISLVTSTKLLYAEPG